MAGLFDLEGQLAFYGAYHSNKVNVLIHLVGVPSLLFSALVLGSAYSPVFHEATLATLAPSVVNALNNTLVTQMAQSAVVNVSCVIALLYGLYYILLEKNFASISYAFGLVLMWVGSCYLVALYPAVIVPYAAGVHIVMWILQFVGHGVFEGRKPALLDNLLQSLVLAPLFVWLEMLFFFGYRPALQKSVHAKAQADIARHRAASRAKRS